MFFICMFVETYSMDVQCIDEVWEPFPVKGYPGYSISNYGRVLSNRKGAIKILKWRKTYKDYFKAKPHKSYSDKQPQFFIHRLVALAFIPNPKKYKQVNHIDCDKSNNHVSNLEWCDQTHNIKHAKENGLNRSLRGDDSPVAKVTEVQVLEIREKFTKGFTAKMLSKEYGLKFCSIYDIIHKRSWKHI